MSIDHVENCSRDALIVFAREEAQLTLSGRVSRFACVVEASEGVGVIHPNVGLGLDGDAGDVAVPGEQVALVEWVRAGARRYFGQRLRAFGPLLQEVADFESVLEAPRVARIDEARDLLQQRHLLLDLLVDGAQGLEKADLEDAVARPQRDEDIGLPSVSLAEGVVLDTDRVVGVEEALGRRIQVEVLQLSG